MALKNDEHLSVFAQRLLALMKEQKCETPKALAKILLEKKLVVVKTRGKDKYKNRDNAIGSVEKKIRAHLHADDAKCLQGEFVNAYCKLFACSADYLFGYTDIQTPDVEIRKICDVTGLSEKAVVHLIEYKRDSNNDSDFSFTSWWSDLMTGEEFESIPMSWFIFAGKLVEIMDIDKKIEAQKKASAEIELDSPTRFICFEDGEKTLRLFKRDKEDSMLGAYHKLFSLVELVLTKYAEEWAKKQHPHLGEEYYKEEIQKAERLSSIVKNKQE